MKLNFGPLSNLWCLGQIATPESETDMDGGRNDGEGAADTDGDGSGSGEGDEHKKHNSDTDGGLEAGQMKVIQEWLMERWMPMLT